MIKNLISSAVVSVIVFIIAVPFIPTKTVEVKPLGGRIETTLNTFGGGIQVGKNPATAQPIGFITAGSCNPATRSSFAATSTIAAYCSVPGVLAGDTVLASLPVGAGVNASGSGSPYGGFEIVAAFASTSDAIGITYFNGTGAATSSYAQATTSVKYVILRTQSR